MLVSATICLAVTLILWVISSVFALITKHTAWYVTVFIVTLLLLCQIAGWIYQADLENMSCFRTSESLSAVSVTKPDIDL